GIPGSPSMVGCGDSLWQHVYHPSRLLVQQDCLTVTGVIVDATAGQAHHQPDGVRHEADGDTHGWLQVDSQFVDLINPGNRSDEGGNLVFEIVCHYTVTQSDAQPACAGFTDRATIPPIGTHVAITGTFVQERNHKKWNEIHPVSRIEARENLTERRSRSRLPDPGAHACGTPFGGRPCPPRETFPESRRR